MVRRRTQVDWRRHVIEGGLLYLGWKLIQLVRTESIRGQVVLITGGSRGLGFVLARHFARQGCRLVLCARDDGDLTRAREELEQSGAEVMTHVCDVSDRDAVEAMIAAVVQRFGQLDIVVNNAGIIQVGPLGSMTLGDFDRAMAVNFWGPLHVTWAALPLMRERRQGRIVNITSIGAQMAIPHLLPYDCAKAAFLNLSEGLQAELAQSGVHVTTIVPGLMRTGSPLNAQFKGDAEREYRWFSAGDSLPLTSMSAERAARRIVASVRRGEGHVTLSWQAKLLRLVHDLAPNLTIRAFGLVNALLPKERGLPFDHRRGAEVAKPSRITKPLEAAAQKYNQVPG